MKRAGKPWIHELAYIIHFSDGKIDIMKGYYDSAHLNTHVADKK
jgi:ketosteroid isomerase-like protein